MGAFKWNTLYTFEDNKVYRLRYRTLTLFIKKNHKHWSIGEGEPEPSGSYVDLEIPEEPLPQPPLKKWKSWFLEGSQSTLIFLPQTPDRPLVIRPGNEITIPPGNSASFFLPLPLWLQVGGGKKMILKEYPLARLSNTWFGQSESGELCYSLKCPPVFDYNEKKDDPHIILCPTKIINKSKTPLETHRFLLDARYLSLFKGESPCLWSSHITISFQGEEQLSQITVSPQTPAFDKNCKLITPPREKGEKNFVKKSFQFLKEISGF